MEPSKSDQILYEGNYKDVSETLNKLILIQDINNLDVISVVTTNLDPKNIYDDMNVRKTNYFFDYGFIPSKQQGLRNVEDEVKAIIRNIFIYKNATDQQLLTLSSYRSWDRISDALLISRMESNPDDVNYLVRGKGRLLRLPSGRPINTMAILRSNGFKVVRLSYEEGKKGYVILGSDVFFSVNRYSAGMSRGLYFNENKDKFCGTFYYFEPLSYIWLSSNKDRFMFFRNKVDAVIRMFNRIAELKMGIDRPINYSDVNSYQEYQKNVLRLESVSLKSKDDLVEFLLNFADTFAEFYIDLKVYNNPFGYRNRTIKRM